MDLLAKNLLILASAGSGKTYQLTNRIAGIVARGGAPEKIVALTFTRKAAGEFADSLLMKLAKAAQDPIEAQRFRQEIRVASADVPQILEQVVRALPRFNLGTMDGFFSKVLRLFPHELGLAGDSFQLLEGPAAAAIQDTALASVLGDMLDAHDEEPFLRAFRRATLGRSTVGVVESLRQFANLWRGWLWRSPDTDWGKDFLDCVGVDDWERQKTMLAESALRAVPDQEYSRKGQDQQLEKVIKAIGGHTIGSGSLNKAGNLFSNLVVEAFTAGANEDDPITLKHYTSFTIRAPLSGILRRLLKLCVSAEAHLAVERTQAIHQVVSIHDAWCEVHLRKRGWLGFDDIKRLMGAWLRSDEDRVLREWVDFRMDSQTDHWLLDEFQDTSREDWAGLENLVNEAANREDGTLFVVGDRKQAIYGWRGGDVGLFDDLLMQHAGNLHIEPMAESWRSCPAVLKLVNRVCGNLSVMKELFGSVADRWCWDEHVSARPNISGVARVEQVSDTEAAYERTAKILHQLGAGTGNHSFGILLRSNESVRKVADFLRLEGFDVIEEGRRYPAKDQPVGIAMLHLLLWLANPADRFARRVLEMSPIGKVLTSSTHGNWDCAWLELTTTASKRGFAGMVEEVIGMVDVEISDHGKHRARELVSALEAFDQQGGSSAREAAQWLARLESAQSSGEASVQVMTIHKSKGLGFDVVILPEIPKESIPAANRFEVAQGPGWICSPPPLWVREQIPELAEAELRWGDNQRYEAFCMLYVALTRAKRGLYVMLPSPPKSEKSSKSGEFRPSLDQWIRQAVNFPEDENAVVVFGDEAWAGEIQIADKPTAPAKRPTLPKAKQKPGRITPSGSKKPSEPGQVHSVAGMQFGTEFHALMEQVSWIDESLPQFPENAVGNSAAALLDSPEVAEYFRRKGRRIRLLREQPVLAMSGENYLTGVIDRLHVHEADDGRVTHVEVLDYKTDSVDGLDELAERYSGQMDAYRHSLEMVFPGVPISCVLLSSKLAAAWVLVEGAEKSD